MGENKNISLTLDESMIKNIEEYKLIKDLIKCAICSGILIRPKQCQECESFFCENCINNWKTTTDICPKRCSNFIIKEASKLMKSLLDKLIIQCTYCKNEFNYENYIYKHFPECYRRNRMVKCPICSNCQVAFKFIEDYEKKIINEKEQQLLKEKEELSKELKLYKEKIEKYENDKKILFKWNRIQNKNNFLLSNNNKTIKINYSGCYNLYFLDYIFEGEYEYSFGVAIKSLGNIDYHCLGFMNEYENICSNNCLCREPTNSFYIRIDSEQLYSGKNNYKINLENKNNINLKFDLNLKTKKLEIKNYNSSNSYGTIDITGTKFKFFVGKCNSGEIEYTLLP